MGSIHEKNQKKSRDTATSSLFVIEDVLLQKNQFNEYFYLKKNLDLYFVSRNSEKLSRVIKTEIEERKFQK